MRPFGLGITPFNRIAYCRRRGDGSSGSEGRGVHGWVSQAPAMLRSGLGTTGTSSASWTFMGKLGQSLGDSKGLMVTPGHVLRCPELAASKLTREPRVAVQTPGTWCRLSASGRAPGSEPVARSCGFGRLAISARARPCLIGGDDSHHGTLLVVVAMVRVGGGDSACFDPVGTPPGFRDTVDPVQGGPHDQVVRGSVEVAHQALSQNRSRNPTSQRCSSNPRGRLVVLRGTRAGGHEETYAEHNRLRTPGTPMLGSPCQT